MPLLRTTACAVLLCCAAAGASGGASFQDELRAPPSRAAPSTRRFASAAFQDSAWQAGRREAADERGGALYREPFALADDADIHQLVDLAHDRVLALARAADPEHDGRLRAGDVRECVRLAAAAAVTTIFQGGARTVSDINAQPPSPLPPSLPRSPRAACCGWR